MVIFTQNLWPLEMKLCKCLLINAYYTTYIQSLCSSEWWFEKLVLISYFYKRKVKLESFFFILYAHSDIWWDIRPFEIEIFLWKGDVVSWIFGRILVSLSPAQHYKYGSTGYGVFIKMTVYSELLSLKVEMLKNVWHRFTWLDYNMQLRKN